MRQIAAAELARHVADLPSLPAVVLELLAVMDEADTPALAAKLALDQALAAKTLRLANSSFYGMSARVSSISQAIAVLGIHNIRTIVTACSVTGSFAPEAGSTFDFLSFWRHSVGTAVCAKLLARRLKLSADTAFTAGLLHDIGRLVLATRFVADYEEVLLRRRSEDCYLIEAEQAVLGIDHCMAGSALAAYWKFPAAIQDAVAEHHGAEDPGAAPLVLLVQAANTLAHGLDLSGVEEDLAPPISHRAWDALKLSEADSIKLFEDAETEFRDTCAVLFDEGA